MAVAILKHEHYGLTMINVDNDEYAIGTYDQAVKACEEYCTETVWAFTSDFVAGHSCLSSEAIAILQENLCEDCNDDLIATIEDMTEFVNEAIACDGLGHFLATYDGEELTLTKFLENCIGSLDFHDIEDIKEAVQETDTNKILVFRVN